MMVVARVRLYATLRRYAPHVEVGKAFELDLPLGSTIADLTRRLQIGPDEIKLTFVNSVQQDADYIIVDGDEVGMFPAIAGGSK